MKAELARQYTEANATHNYIFGFVSKHIVYKVTMMNASAEAIEAISKLDYDSRNKTASLRFIPNKEQKTFLMTLNPEVVCEEQEIENLFKNSKYNRGEIFEKMITEENGQVWKKDNVKFTNDGDITINGIKFQIKYNKATFTNVKTLQAI